MSHVHLVSSLQELGEMEGRWGAQMAMGDGRPEEEVPLAPSKVQ